MDERPRRRRLVAEGVHVRHDVVPEAPLVARGRGEVDVVEVRAHLRQRLAPGSATPSSRSASASASQSRRQSPIRCGSPQSGCIAGEA